MMENNGVTHAKIRFIDDKVIKTIQINEILEFKNKLPSSVKDFNKDGIYSIMWKDDKNPDPIRLPIQIGELAGESNRFQYLYTHLFYLMFFTFSILRFNYHIFFVDYLPLILFYTFIYINI